MSSSQRSGKMLLATAAFAAVIAVIASVRLFLQIEENAIRCVGANSGANCGGMSALVWAAVAALLICLVALAIRWAAMVKARISLGILERIAIASVSVAIVVTGVLTLLDSAGSTGVRAGLTADGARPSLAPKAASDGRRAITETDRESASPKFRHPFPDVPQSRKGLALETELFMAESVAEQEWLDRNGYPNAAQWAAYSTAADVQLEAAALAGDKTAAAMFAQRQFIQGDETAIERMLTAGATGNTFALELLASTLIGPKQDPVAGYAMSRVVEMRGNIRIGFHRDAMFNTPLSPMERIEGEQQAIEMYQTLLRLQRTILGNNSPAADMRPIGG